MFANLFNKKSKIMLGVDISSSAVKVIELSKKNGRLQVEAYAKEPLPEEAIVDNSINDDQAVTEALRRALSRARSGIKKAAVAVPISAAIIKTIEMNAALKDHEMDLQIRAEADQHLPFSQEGADEVALDWEVEGPSAKTDELVNVKLVACRAEAVERRKDAVDAAGLEVVVMDVEAFTTESAFELIHLQFEPHAETIAIMDIGASMSSLNILHKGQSIYTYEQVFGGNQLTEEISNRYGISNQEAEKAKFEGNLPDEYEAEVLEPFRNAVVQQIGRSLQFFYSSSQFNEVDCIALAGGTASIPLLAEQIQEELRIPTVICNPFVGMTLANKINPRALSEDAPALLTACGLAMRSFD